MINRLLIVGLKHFPYCYILLVIKHMLSA